ncbi:hypothetical protein ACUOFU_16560 [Microbacterium arabinogalactanolyticum]|uniref:hypothetical protein n=1 Tax=Microbacterium arabinogalactanolyticum TaxID=69365 RepID=UPI0040443869
MGRRPPARSPWLRRMQQKLLVSPEALAADPRISSRALRPDAICAVAGVPRLAELGPRNTRFVEPAQLRDPVQRVVVLREALEHGIRMLFVEVASPLEGVLLADDLPGLVHPVDDAPQEEDALHAVNVVQLLRFCLASAPVETAEALTGMPTRHVPRAAMRLLPPDAPVRRMHPLRRLMGDPSVPVYLAVGIYSALRALPVAFIPQFHGSLLVLWMIDILTAVPYTWGVLAMLFAPRRWIRMLATLTTITTFAAPYVYFWMHGRDYPPFVVAVIAALTIASISIEVVKYLQERMLRRRYRSARVAATVRMIPVRITQAPETSQTTAIQGSAVG